MIRKDVRIAKAWEYKGKKCLIIWTGSHFCGYGETSLKIGYSDGLGTCDTSPESNINAHGGLTFSGKHDELPNNPFDNNIWYFGFDCAHYGDAVEFEYLSKTTGHKWTEEEVIKETERMVDGIIEYEKLYPKFKKAFEEFKKEIKRNL